MPVFDLLRKNKNEQKSQANSPTSTAAPQADHTYIEIDVDKIYPNPNQPRHIFDDEALKELAQSIDQIGLIQPLSVQPVDDKYELIAGERRLRAIKLLGWEKAPCFVKTDVVQETSAVMALIENLQRENLHFLEEAESYASLLCNYSMTQETLAVKLGKSQSSIANKLRLLKLSPEVLEQVTAQALSERHTRALLKLTSDEDKLNVIKLIAEKSLSVKETERLVEKMLNDKYDNKADGARPRPVIVRLIKDYRLFVNSVNLAIDQLKDSGMAVETEQTERDDGVDIVIHVTNPQNIKK